MTSPPTIQLKTASPQETLALGERLGQAARPGDCVALVGQLGAGKTLLVKGIARGLGIPSATITSPTFVLIHRHTGRLVLYHLDAYRLADSDEMLAVGAEEALYGNGLSAIEWADRVADILPDDRLDIVMTVTGATERSLKLHPSAARGQLLARAAAHLSPKSPPPPSHRPSC